MVRVTGPLFPFHPELPGAGLAAEQGGQFGFAAGESGCGSAVFIQSDSLHLHIAFFGQAHQRQKAAALC